MQEEIKKQPKHDDEIDLGIFFTVIGRALKKLGALFLAIYNFIADAILWFALLLKRNLVWLIIWTGIGFLFGLYKYLTNGPSYYSDMVVSANFESSRLLYQKIDYFNALIGQGQTKELARIFDMNEEDVAKLGSFEIKPVDDPLQTARLYKANFLEYKRNSTAWADTAWTRTIRFKDFEENLTKFDYPLHTIRLYSKSAVVYPKVQKGFLSLIDNNKFLQEAKAATSGMLKTEEELLVTSLAGIDSLRKAYNQKILKDAGEGSREFGGVVFTQGSPRAPEVELYDKELMLKDELMDVKKRRMEQQDIIQVYSDFNNVGTQISIYRGAIIRFTFLAAGLALIVILLNDLNKRLNHLQAKKKQNKI